MDTEVTITNKASEDHNNNTTNTGNTSSTALKSMVGYVVVPYTKGLSESFKRICGKYGIQTYFKRNTTIRQTLMKPKDQDTRDNRSGVYIQIQVSRHHLQGGIYRNI